ncbi:Sec-independent protein translocase protein TatB [Rhodocista pekingensis]|uniref:Sec-independent protein translocase protein TatB n=1 Tax=Rhodocista pekingensis TaxID=201185 RepID=A0ABW2KRU5_9PROT
MFDIGWPELAVILIVALIVIGPKDLPRAMHTVGKWVRKARMLAREFQSNMDEMVRQAELEDLKKEVERARQLNLKDQLEKHIDPKGTLKESLSFDPVPLDGDEAEEDEGGRPAPTPLARTATTDAQAPQPAPAGTVPASAAPVSTVPVAAPQSVIPSAAPPAAPRDVPAAVVPVADQPAAEKRG